MEGRSKPESLEELIEYAYDVCNKNLNSIDIFDKSTDRHSLDLSRELSNLAEQGPVAFGWKNQFENLLLPDIFAVGDRQTALVLDYPGVKQVMYDWKSFDQDFYPDEGGVSFIHLNGEAHRRYRLLLMPVFSAKAVKHWEEFAVPPVIDKLLSEYEGKEKADFLNLTRAYPARVFRSLLGLPEEDIDRVRALGVVTIVAQMMPDGDVYVKDLLSYLGDQIDARRILPEAELLAGTDLISRLINTRDGDRKLSDDEIKATLFTLVQAGVDTTALLAGNALFMMLSRPGVLKAIKADRSLIPALIEETLRMITAGSTFEARRAVHDVDVCGTIIPAGTPVYTCHATANRDARFWDNPNEFRLDRPGTLHFSFGYGAHMCVGMHLARMEIRCFLEAVLDRFPNIRLDPDAPMPEIAGAASPHPDSIPVLLT